MAGSTSRGTIVQPDAGLMLGGALRLAGGFWHLPVVFNTSVYPDIRRSGVVQPWSGGVARARSRRG